MNVPIHWNKASVLEIYALIAIGVTTLMGVWFGHVLGAPKTFFLIAIAMVVWAVAGWLFGGARVFLAGLTALAGALTGSEGLYAVALVFTFVAILIVVADVGPRRELPGKSLGLGR
jgi:hypothetical protein